MAVKLGNTDINKVYLGTTEIKKMYLGSTLIYDKTSGGAFDADYQAVLNYATAQGYTLPSAGQQILQNQLVLDLKGLGVWSTFDALWVLANDGSKEFATINWKAPTANQATLVASPTWTVNKGTLGNGTTAYVNLNFTPSTHGVNYTQNNASRIYLRLRTTLNLHEGSLSGFINFTDSANNANNGRINSSNNLSATWDKTGAGARVIQIHRTSSTNVECFNETVQTSLTQTSTVLPTSSQCLHRCDASFSASEFAIYGLGGDMSSNALGIRTALLNYYNAL